MNWHSIAFTGLSIVTSGYLSNLFFPSNGPDKSWANTITNVGLFIVFMALTHKMFIPGFEFIDGIF